jgi:hypothetical protein
MLECSGSDRDSMAPSEAAAARSMAKRARPATLHFCTFNTAAAPFLTEQTHIMELCERKAFGF